MNKKALAQFYVFNDNWDDLTVSSDKCFRIVDGKMVTQEDDKRSPLERVLDSVKERAREIENQLYETEKDLIYINTPCESGRCDKLNAIISEYSSMDPGEFWLKAIRFRCICYRDVSFLWNQRYGTDCPIPDIHMWYDSINMSEKRSSIRKMVEFLEKQ